MDESNEVLEISLESRFSKEEVLVSADTDLLKRLESIPDKMAFKIGEVAEIVGVKQYVLRYWETEFEVLRPKKSNQNQRMYTKKDVETVLLIEKLLYRDRFSISGARSAIKKLKSKVKSGSSSRESFKKHRSAIERARKLLGDIRRLKTNI